MVQTTDVVFKHLNLCTNNTLSIAFVIILQFDKHDCIDFHRVNRCNEPTPSLLDNF